MPVLAPVDGRGPLGHPAAMDDAHLDPLTQWLAARARRGQPPLIGLNGSQGSGKSTLAAALRERLAAAGVRAAILSIDDLYLGRAEREALAATVHPLLRTRGVPGTHDLALARQVLQALRQPQNAEVAVPAFVKARDDRAAPEQWPLLRTPLDLVLFEGWCVGTPPQDEAGLLPPVNALEAREDADGRWRRYVNEQLAGGYADLFAGLDALLFLQAPDFDCIYRWRLQQEAGNAAAAGTPGMEPAALRRFIQHYERLTRHALRVLPGRADLVVELGPRHEWRQLHWRRQ